MRRPPPLGSPHRGILCVEKIGSVAPELQERPGTPSKAVKSTNGPFYWLTRKRAPPLSLDPCRWTPVGGPLLGDPCKNRVRAGIGGWPGTATGGQIHVVHISHTHPLKELIQALRKYLLRKKLESDLEKCCKMSMLLQKSAPIQPRQSLPKCVGVLHGSVRVHQQQQHQQSESRACFAFFLLLSAIAASLVLLCM